MVMAYQEDKGKSAFLKSFVYAFCGIFTSFKERNMLVHYIVAVCIVAASAFFKLSTVEWLFVITCIAGVIALEMVNTAIERVVDLNTDEFHQLAKEAKDLAAGAVLIYSLYSVIVGCMIFLPKVWNLISW